MFPMALATGNTMILKPSEKTPAATTVLAEIAQEAGVPKGVFNLVQGSVVILLFDFCSFVKLQKSKPFLSLDQVKLENTFIRKELQMVKEFRPTWLLKTMELFCLTLIKHQL